MVKAAPGRPLKYNWPLIFEELDRGLPWREVAHKYSIGERVMYEKMRARKKALAAEIRKPGKTGETGSGEVALYKPSVQIGANSAPLTAPPPLTETPELTESELLTLLSDPAAILALKPEDAQTLLAKRTQMLLLQGFATVEAPSSIKDLTSLAKLWREASGLSAKEGKGGGGLLAPVRSGGRRMVTVVQDAEVLETEGEDVIDWPEGM